MPNKVSKKHTSHATTARDFFLYLLMLIALYMSVVSFIAVLFQYINVLVHDPLDNSLISFYNSIRISSATLVVGFPVFLLTSFLILRDLKKDAAKKDIWVRRWLVYLTLFIAAVTIIIDLIQLIYNFYGGDLGLRFLLKTLAVLVVAGGVFGYFMYELRRDIKKTALLKVAAIIMSVIVGGILIGGFFIAGTPAEQRQLRLDEQRISDLQTIQGLITDYYTQQGKLPTDLNELASKLGVKVPTDPEAGRLPSGNIYPSGYVYTVGSGLKFSLCATFYRERTDVTQPGFTSPALIKPYSVPNSPFSYNWNHAAGYVCFERQVDATDRPATK